MNQKQLSPDESSLLAAMMAAGNPPRKPGRRCFRPAKGFVQNPLMRLPRNMACPCASGKKWKKCCLELTQPYIPADALKSYLDTEQEALAGQKAW